MSNKKIGICIKVAVVVVTLAGLLMCAWYPYDVLFSSLAWRLGVPDVVQMVKFIARVAFSWGVSIPCFMIMGLMWKVSARISRGETFSFDIYKYLRLSATTLFIDCGVYFVGNAVFYALGCNPLFIVYMIIGIIGVAVAFCMAALASMAKNAAALKEDNDSIL